MHLCLLLVSKFDMATSRRRQIFIITKFLNSLFVQSIIYTTFVPTFLTKDTHYKDMNKISTFAFLSSITMETWVQTEFESLYQRLEIVMKGENIRIVHNIKQGSTLLFGEGKTMTISLNYKKLQTDHYRQWYVWQDNQRLLRFQWWNYDYHMWHHLGQQDHHLLQRCLQPWHNAHDRSLSAFYALWTHRICSIRKQRRYAMF